MAVHEWSSNVLGGVESPRCLLVGPELNTNVSFETDLTGWVSPSAGASRVANSEAPAGDYVLKMEDDDGGSAEYVEIVIDAGETVAGKKFIVHFYGRNEDTSVAGSFYTKFVGLSVDGEREFTAQTVWKLHMHELVIPLGATGNSFTWRIYPTAKIAGVGGLGSVLFDNIKIRKVKDDIRLAEPPRGTISEVWEPEYWAQPVALNGLQRQHIRGYRYRFAANYPILNIPSSYGIRKMQAENAEMLFFPHQDAELAHWVLWDDDFAWNWAGGIAIGHESRVAVKSRELLHRVPTQLVDATTVYTPTEEEFYGEGVVGYE